MFLLALKVPLSAEKAGENFLEGLETGMGGAAAWKRWSQLCIRGIHGCWSVCLQRRFLLVIFYIFSNFDAA